MTEHTALYRKYRPTKFKEVKDQDHIVTVLEGAIKKGDIPHAILFTGGRGTGKTTLARIFAHEIGTSEMDLYEIDAASNRGIDDIRELRDAVHTLPYESKYKVYIIDEVHMLTKEAFNALLKTLEEPPEHVVFILATTEVEKLLDTILSRCQVFTLHSPNRAVLAKMVTEVAKKEGFALDPAAADLIAIAADGSFRDAHGVLQKVILASGDTIGGGDEVAALIGAPKAALLARLTTALHEKDTETALQVINEALQNHVDMKLFVRLLIDRVRAVLFLRNAPALAAELTGSLSNDEHEQLKLIATATPSPINSHVLLRLLETAQLVGRINIPHVALEQFVLTICEQKD